MTPLSLFAALPEAPSPSGEALCARCAARGTSCCATEPALGHLSFPLSPMEWRRLLRWRHLASEAADADAPAPIENRNRNEEDAARPAGEEPPRTRPGKEAKPGEDAAAGGEGPPGEQTPPKDGDACCQTWDNTPEFLASMHSLFPNERERIERLFPENGKHFSLRLRQDGACVFLGAGGCRLPRAARPWYCLLFPIWFTVGGPGLFAAEGCLIAESARSRAQAVRLLGVSVDSLRDIFARLREDWGLESELEDVYEKI